jgi:hypothetical protein
MSFGGDWSGKPVLTEEMVERQRKRAEAAYQAKRDELEKSVGRLVVLLAEMPEETAPNQPKVGERGTITAVKPGGIMHVKWESGSTTRLLASDPYELIGIQCNMKAGHSGGHYRLPEEVAKATPGEKCDAIYEPDELLDLR